ncbi:MAG: FtsQ-type POTRA domain-containing protein [Oscillospiraceae bacterium]|nr:FtsQ-type POTRA domain-containing protein [Oscillospiraceae bacterium]
MAKQTKRRRRRSNGFAIRLITMLAVILAVLFCVFLFFRIETIAVSGSTHYTDEEIVSASGLSVGDNLMLMNKSAAASDMMAWLPYVQRVKISRKLPGTAVITVQECNAVAAAQDESGAWWLLGADCKLLEQIDAANAEQYMALTGVTLTAPVIGCIAQATQEDAIGAAATMLTAMEQYALLDVITGVDLTKLYAVEIWYGKRFEIKLGSTDNLAYKIQYLQAVLKNLNENQSGVIDLTFENDAVARFLPW